jgi:hypothetical protein
MRYLLIILSFLILTIPGMAQPVPAQDENIPFLMTFGKGAETSWGDEDFSQTFFFKVPVEYTKPVYIKIFDPDCGGQHDEVNGVFDTRTTFEIFGGKECWSNLDAQETNPVGNYKSGNLLASKAFTVDDRYDNNWYIFGPFNPTEGEWSDQENGYIFKIIVEGVAGDDGNLYRFFLSTDETTNKPVEGANAFAYEYSFRMHNSADEVSHIYPYIDDRTITVRQSNFDWDRDGYFRIVSVARKEQISSVSNEDDWVVDEFAILEGEKNSSLDFQFIKSKDPVIRNNNVVVNIRNQYNEALKFYVIPIGGVPKYKYSIGVKR